MEESEGTVKREEGGGGGGGVGVEGDSRLLTPQS